MDTHVRVKQDTYNKIKEISVSTGRNIKDEIEYALQCHIKEFRQEQIMKESNFESLLNDRFGKLDKHLSSMMARTGIDVSMTLMGVVTILAKFMGTEEEKEVVLEILRKSGVKYFTEVVQKDKAEKKNL